MAKDGRFSYGYVAAALHGLGGERLLWEKAADEALAAFGAEVDAAVFRALRAEGTLPARSGG